MSRTTRKINVSQSVETVRPSVILWLAKNGFKIVAEDSDGKETTKRVFANKISLTPQKGSLVAVNCDLGYVVFELLFIPQSSESCILNGDFYVAGATFFRGRELAVTEKNILFGRLPIRKGKELMERFIEEFEDEASGVIST